MAMQITAAELIQYGIEVKGQDAAVRAFTSVAQAQQQSQKSADALSQSLRATSRTAEVEARAVERATQAHQRAALANMQASAAANTNARSMGGIAQIGQRASIILGTLTTSAQGVAPAVAGMGAAISRASGAIGAMTNVLGGGAAAGPWGLAIGAAVVGIGLLSASFKTQKEKADEATASLREWVEETHAVAEAADAAALANRSRADTIRIGQEQARKDEARRRGIAQTGLFDSANRASPVGYGTGVDYGTDDDGKPFTSEAEARAYIDKKSAELRTKRGTGARPKPIDIFPDNPAQNASDARAAEARAAVDARATAAEAAREEYDERQRVLAEMQVAQTESYRSIQYAHDQKLKATLDGYAKEEAAAKKAAATIKNAGVGAWMAVGSSAAQVLQQVAAGQEVSAKQVLAALGSTLIGQGTGYIFQGTAETIMGLPSGPPLIGVGTAEVAFGMGLGAAGRGGADGASAGGGSGGSGFFARPASPTYSQANVVDRSGETYEFHFHTLEPMDPAAFGAKLERYKDAARRNGLISGAAR